MSECVRVSENEEACTHSPMHPTAYVLKPIHCDLPTCHKSALVEVDDLQLPLSIKVVTSMRTHITHVHPPTDPSNHIAHKHTPPR